MHAEGELQLRGELQSSVTKIGAPCMATIFQFRLVFINIMIIYLGGRCQYKVSMTTWIYQKVINSEILSTLMGVDKSSAPMIGHVA